MKNILLATVIFFAGSEAFAIYQCEGVDLDALRRKLLNILASDQPEEEYKKLSYEESDCASTARKLYNTGHKDKLTKEEKTIAKEMNEIWKMGATKSSKKEK